MEHWLTRAARMRPDRAALVTPARTWSYAALLARASEVAAALARDGVGAGDRIALELGSEDLVVALHACLLIGAAAAPVDLRLTERERMLRRDGCRLTLTALPRSREGVAAAAPVRAAPGDLDAVATVMFTSGTTGAPKRVELTLANWLWNAIGSATALGLDPDERWLCPMPLAHVGGLSVALRSVVYGTTVVLEERFDTGRVLARLRDPAAAVTVVSLVPTMLARLLEAGLRDPPTLRRVLLGGGPIAPSLLERAHAAGVAVSPSFGMTETGSQIVTDGFPLLGAEADIDAQGELLVRGPSVAAGALGVDGWLHTGDLARRAPDGRLSIVGRSTDTIVTGGENVAPTEIEAVLLAHPAVADAAVVGRPDPEWGERVVALVVTREPVADGDALAGVLRAHCAAGLAPFKVPKTIEWVSELPRSSTGKLQRRELA